MNPSPPPRNQFALWAVPGLCFALTAFLTLRYVIAVPMIDQWDFVPVLQKAYAHTLTFGDLWAQHNEHRLLFPRLIMLGLARLSHWDLRWELATSLLFALAILGVFAWQVKQTARLAGDATLWRVFPVAGIIIFSLRQSENWMWGWQLQIFLNVLAVVTGVALLTNGAQTGRWTRLFAAVGCGIVATYSFANGLLFWLVGAYALCALPRDKTFGSRLAVWCVCALLTGASYFYQYVKPPGSPPLLYTLAHPVAFAAYFLSYIGAFISIKDTPLIGVPMGLLGLALLGISWRRLRASQRLPAAALAPYVAYAGYVLLSALVSTVGRAGFGAKQAMSSRYLTISELFWLAALVLGYLAIRQQETAASLSPTTSVTTAQDGPTAQERAPEAATTPVFAAESMGQSWAARLIVLAGLVFALNSLKNIRVFKQRYEFAVPVEQQMLQSDFAAGADTSNTPNVVQERAPFLKQHHLALYRNR